MHHTVVRVCEFSVTVNSCRDDAFSLEGVECDVNRFHVLQARATSGGGGGGGGGRRPNVPNPFCTPDMMDRLKQSPETKAYMEDGDFVAKLEELSRDPNKLIK